MNKYIENIISLLIELNHKIKNRQVPIKTISVNELSKLFETVYSNEVGEGKDYAQNVENLLFAIQSNGEVDIFSEILDVLIINMIFLNKQKELLRKEQQRRENAFVKYAYNKNLLRNKGRHGKEDLFMGKGVIYTVITGDYDEVHIPKQITEGLDYVLFTNNPNISSDFWTVVFIDNPMDLDDHRLSRYVKMFPKQYLQGYDYSIYVDSSIIITGDLQELIHNYYISESLICFNHPTRDCIYDEMQACEELKKDSPEIMHQQIEGFKNEGYPEHYGLICGGVLVRSHHSNELDRLMKEWWSIVESGSKRDQLAFNYVCWKNNFFYDSCEMSLYACKYFEFVGHKR